MTDSTTNELKDKIHAGKRIGAAEALSLFAWDLLELGMAADFRTRLIAPGGKAGFIVDRIINYTNICEACCLFCAFHARAGQIEPYELSMEAILAKVDELAEIGGTQVMLQGGLHPRHTLDTYISLVKTVKTRHPKIRLHSFSPAELVHISRKQGIGIHEVIGRLKESGLDSVPGASDLLVDRVRRRVDRKSVV